MKGKKPKRRQYLNPTGSAAGAAPATQWTCDRHASNPSEYGHMDAGIRKTVQILVGHGIETMQSCQGGAGHCYPEPIVEFGGAYADGFKALSIALQHGFKVSELRRVWSMQDGEPVGPHWALVFSGLPVSAHG